MLTRAVPRRLLSGVLAAATIAAAACQPQTPAPSTSGGVAPAPATTGPSGPTGKLTSAVASPVVTSMDTGSGNSAQTLQFAWPSFDGLTWISADGKINPGLAKEWRSVDAQTWEFKLGDYKFQNGRAVEAQDVVDTYERTRDPEKKLQGRAIFTSNNVDKVLAPDNKTVRVSTTSPNPIIPNMVQLLMILPMREMNAVGEVEFFRNKPIGTGPFRVESIDFQSSLKYSAMGKEWVTPRGVPSFKDLEIKIVPDLVARAAALRTGDIDLALALNPDQIPVLEQNGFKIFQTAGTSTAHFGLDMFTGPTTNLKVRQAINYAVDRNAIQKVFYGGRARVDSGQLIGPDVLGYNKSIQPIPFDPAKAKALLAEAGYPNGFKINMTMINLSTINKDLAQIVADNLRDVGITVDIQIKESAVWLQEHRGSPERRPGLFVQVMNWDQTFEPDVVYRWYSDRVGLDAGQRWEDAQFAKLYDAATTELDRTKRGQAYQQAAAYLNSQVPVLFGWQVFGVYAGKKNLSLTDPGHADFFTGAKPS
ncbi:MAG: ABC transporter substrate-binding protein [Dehalococcoidia bacterium]